MPSSERSSTTLALGILLLGTLARLVPHPPNVTPVTALGLFAGAVLWSTRWTAALPLAMVVLSDLVIGVHEVVPFTWGSFLLIGWLGSWLRRDTTAGRIVLASVAGSVLFFLVTNFGVWLVGEHGTMYPKTWAGFVSCFTAALPFFRNTLIGDLCFTMVLFGIYRLMTRQVVPDTGGPRSPA